MKKTLLPVLLLSALFAAGCSTTSEGRSSETLKSAEAAVDDATITAKVKSALLADPDISGLKINVDTAGGVVKLKGEIKSMALRRKAESIVRDVKGVKSVDNQLIITG